MGPKTLLAMLSVACVMSPPIAQAGEAVPTQSVGDLAVFVAHEKFRIYLEVCSRIAPDSRTDNESISERLTARTKVVGDNLLATAEFSGLRREAPTTAFVGAVREDFENVRRQQESSVTPQGCKGARDNFRVMDDAKIAAGVASLLREYQTSRTLVGVGGSRSTPN